MFIFTLFSPKRLLSHLPFKILLTRFYYLLHLMIDVSRTSNSNCAGIFLSHTRKIKSLEWNINGVLITAKRNIFIPFSRLPIFVGFLVGFHFIYFILLCLLFCSYSFLPLVPKAAERVCLWIEDREVVLFFVIVLFVVH